MKIQYLKPAPNATTGDIKDISTAQAKILIQLGFAEVYDETTEPVAENQEPSKADEVSEQVQEVAETAPAETATPTETAKPKKTKKTNTENS